MNILNSNIIRFLDESTIQNEPISSIDLMERAARKCAEWIESSLNPTQRILVVCGPDNNGGDGLAITRQLAEKGWLIKALLLDSRNYLSNDCKVNLDRLTRRFPDRVQIIQDAEQLPLALGCDVVVDAIFGIGFKGEVRGLVASAIDVINSSDCTVISIDLPSGLTSNEAINIIDNKIIKSDITITFQFLKPALVMPENAPFFGKVEVLDIGLDASGLNEAEIDMHLSDMQSIRMLLKERESTGHKGNFGHALLMAGGIGKAGAGILAVRSCLRSGCGLVTAIVPKEENPIFQTACPEAMTIQYQESSTEIMPPEKASAVGIGPGIGTNTTALNTVQSLIQKWKKPVIIDADGLNLMSQHHDLFQMIPKGSLLTPHVGEFERLFGKCNNDFERLELQKSMSKTHQWIILLKGAYTKITTPDGKIYVNSTGNAGMAKGGSGDVLTGLITGLHARGYQLTDAAILGAYLHGLAGDLSAEKLGIEAMNAGDLIEFIPAAWQTITKY